MKHYFPNIMHIPMGIGIGSWGGGSGQGRVNVSQGLKVISKFNR